MAKFYHFSKILIFSIIFLSLITACSDTNVKNDSEIYSDSLKADKTSLTESAGVKDEKQQLNQQMKMDQKLIKTADLSIETKKFNKTINALEKSVTNYNGYIQSNQVSGTSLLDQNNKEGHPSRSAHYTIRIPSSKLNAYLESINKIGNIISKSISSEDISNQYFDTETRVKSLKIQEERLLDLLKKSGSLSDIIQLEKELSNVRYEIESLTTTLKSYDSLVNYSTINLSVIEVATITDTTPPKTVSDRIAVKFKENIKSISNGLKNTTVFLVGNSLLIIFWLIILGVGFFLTRKAMKKYNEWNIPK
ncbi:DUF4349 domain-containing protein [Bacillus sp. EAC]|uniref:DUF4349 domain-containing protein n=1 Tax=Bacillus sp. EAC TaxID=1978338 RepID=UPI000B44EDBE|nr:DUF4349 domain-containing protein [Bacillus sp. EAC]